MRWSYRIARVGGIDVKIHITFLLLLAWFGWIYWQQGGLSAAVKGVGFTLLLFLCVLLHEFGHALAARAFGIRTPDITLLPIGGVARLERMPSRPWQEFVVAIAGPMVNVAIAGFLLVVLAFKFQITGWEQIEQADGSLAVNLLAVNVMLVVFNAIPAFPMDGGRVLRALLAMKWRYATATAVAARIGQVLAVGFVAAGYFYSPMLVLIGIFVFMGADQEIRMAKFREIADDKRVADVMAARFFSLPSEMSVGEAAMAVPDDDSSEWPVLDSSMRPVGIVGWPELQQAATSPRKTLSEIVREAPVISASESLTVLLGSFPPGHLVIVVNPAGQAVGIVGIRAVA